MTQLYIKKKKKKKKKRKIYQWYTLHKITKSQLSDNCDAFTYNGIAVYPDNHQQYFLHEITFVSLPTVISSYNSSSIYPDKL